MSATCATLTGIWGAPAVLQLQSLAFNPASLSTCSYLYMTGADYLQLQQLIQAQASVSTSPVASAPDIPYDYATGGAFWAFGFTGVMTIYFAAHVIGLVLKFIKNG